ncbi:MAG: methyl-accepting chemotaxis protein, partial [Nevskia sp.]|nr:methyl-accepting chemotaxis protein [Nevskia sp.]
QSGGIEQVNQAITHMDEATQQNAALVEQVSASAQALEQQSEGLVASVRRFVLEQEPAAPEKPAAPPAARLKVVKPVAAPAAAPPAKAAPAGSRPSAKRMANGKGGAQPLPPSAAGGDTWTEF